MSRPALVVLANAEARRHRRDGGRLLRHLAAEPDVRVFRRASDGTEWPPVTEILALRPRLLAIDGGDGTVMRVLSDLHAAAAPDRWPLLALLPGGSTNATAADCGLRTRRTAALRRLLALARGQERGARVVRRRPLVVAGGGLAWPRVGFLFGAAGVCDLIRLWQRSCRQRGLVGELSHLSLLVRLLLRARTDPALGLRPVRCRLRLDRQDLGEGPRLVVLATTLERIVLGARPWWERGDRPLALTTLPMPPVGLLGLLPRLWAGRVRPERLPAGYASGGGVRATIEGLAEFVLDGDLFGADPKQPLRLSAGEPVRLVRL